MTTDRLPWILLLIALGLLVWQNVAIGRAEGEAAVHAERADSAMSKARADSTANAARRDTIAALDSVLADSSAVWEARARENALRIAGLTRRASGTADSLRVRLDSVGTALLAEYTATTDSLIATQAAQIADLTAERSILWARMETMDELVAGITDENEALREANASLRSANESLRRGLNAAGSQNKWLKLGAVALTGLAVYDRLAGG